ncbi:MAG: Gfo/Idh/MocA family oxidoreductase [Firmicutes bacterium]|nr:Gfo/Idh/MocA family oxidoreductase [Bacillota bacterium]
MKTCIIIGAGGRGKDSYAPYIKKTGIIKIIGVAEPDLQKRSEFCSEYNIAENMAFANYRQLFRKGRLADAVLICTQDRMHLEPALMAIECGYHILLEKPISPFCEEIDRLEAALCGYNRVFMTGFVLRYTPFIKKIKEITDSGKIGKIMNMQINENEGYWHHAHSYVRGQWNNSKTSSPLIVAKSCHDFDLILYLTGSSCKSITSYGSNGYFSTENAPGDVPKRCTDSCPFAAECKYNAVKLYTDGAASYFVDKFECGTERNCIIDALKTNPYGRCVYRCDNDVCDHQVAAMEMTGGLCAVFTVSAFSLRNTRTIKLMGTDGEIGGCMEDGQIVLRRFFENCEERFSVSHDETRHCGGDGGLMRYFAESMENENYRIDHRIFEAHRLTLAAEKSRLEQRRIIM